MNYNFSCQNQNLHIIPQNKYFFGVWILLTPRLSSEQGSRQEGFSLENMKKKVLRLNPVSFLEILSHYSKNT